VGDDIVTGEPRCNFGRGPEECIPGAYVRTNDFPRIASNRGNGHLYATWQDYRAGEFDIQLSQSTDGGLTWSEAKAPVNPDRGKDHYEPAVDVVCSGPRTARNPGCPQSGQGAGDGAGTQRHDLCGGSASTTAGPSDAAGATDHVAISYYRTCRVPDENAATVFAPPQPGVQKENSDYTLSGGHGRSTPYGARPVSPVFPPPDGLQTGFMGDYSGITVVGEVAVPVWSDPRNVIPAAYRPIREASTTRTST
jgi:hypothetical protein